MEAAQSYPVSALDSLFTGNLQGFLEISAPNAIIGRVIARWNSSLPENSLIHQNRESVHANREAKLWEQGFLISKKGTC